MTIAMQENTILGLRAIVWIVQLVNIKISLVELIV